MAGDIMRSRPHTSMGYYKPVEYVDTDTKLTRDFVLAPGFRETLENYYPKASTEDKARCLELLTSLNIGDSIKEQAKSYPEDLLSYQPPACVELSPKKRPKSAMSYYNRGKVDIMNPYSTSYKVDYPEKSMTPTQADRPRSVRNYHASYELSGPIGSSTYQNEYYSKRDTKPLQNTAMEERRNNPHPLESFMVWKLGRNPVNENPDLRRQLTDQLMDQVCRGKLTSTYQQDYLGMPQGHSGIKEAFAPETDVQARVPYTLDSIMRHSYQKPSPQTELKGNNTRYGCNKSKLVPAHGVVPTVSKRHNFMNLKTRTTYEREYNDQVNPRPTEARDLAKQYGTQSLQRYLTRAKSADRPMIGTMIKTMSDGQPQSSYMVHPPTTVRTPSRSGSRQSSTSSRCGGGGGGGRIHFAVPPTTCLESPNPPQAWDSYLTPQISQQAY